jgi:hypothetical protein
MIPIDSVAGWPRHDGEKDLMDESLHYQLAMIAGS